jgi:hypothetical protein
MKVEAVHPGENFRGMSYGDWAALWWNWLLSEEPDDYDGGDVLFLRGNVEYKLAGGVAGAPSYSDPKGYYDRTGKFGEKIFEGTAIFFPVLTAMLHIGELYDGRSLKNELDIRFAARKDISEGGAVWANIMKKGQKKTNKIVNDVRDYRIESPRFKLEVAEKNRFRDRMESPLKPGFYDCVTVGYYLLIKSLPASIYRIQFGGKGRGTYYTNSLYDITVKKKRKGPVADISGQRDNSGI